MTDTTNEVSIRKMDINEVLVGRLCRLREIFADIEEYLSDIIFMKLFKYKKINGVLD